MKGSDSDSKEDVPHHRMKQRLLARKGRGLKTSSLTTPTHTISPDNIITPSTGFATLTPGSSSYFVLHVVDDSNPRSSAVVLLQHLLLSLLQPILPSLLQPLFLFLLLYKYNGDDVQRTKSC